MLPTRIWWTVELLDRQASMGPLRHIQDKRQNPSRYASTWRGWLDVTCHVGADRRIAGWQARAP